MNREELVRGLIRVGEKELTGMFVREFTHSPVGPLPPNGKRRLRQLGSASA
jgi:hypothetical protein